jgi:Ser/Thr protein kinase RdoA (MazF antagonist)
MPLSEIAGLTACVDDQGRCEVADLVAAAWGLPPGTARFWRSSASHVFAVSGAVGPAPGAYLRFVPEWRRSRERVAAVAELMDRYSRHGQDVAQPIVSAHGRLVETVATRRGGVHAMLVAAAPGRQVEVEELTVGRARAWGAALARLHRHGADDGALAGRLPEYFGDLEDAERALADDRPVVDAIARLRAGLGRLPRDPGCFGVVHGDFELDNVAWNGQTGTAYDFDDAGLCWFAADIAHALRDVQAIGPAWAESPIARAFLTGYRSVRGLPDREVAWLPMFVAAHAAAWLIRLPGIVDSDPARADPPWLVTLRGKLHERAGRFRAIVIVRGRAKVAAGGRVEVTAGGQFYVPTCLRVSACRGEGVCP